MFVVSRKRAARTRQHVRAGHDLINWAAGWLRERGICLRKEPRSPGEDVGFGEPWNRDDLYEHNLWFKLCPVEPGKVYSCW